MMRTGLTASALIIAVMAGVSVYGYYQIPPDMQLSPKREGVLVIPLLLALGISILFALIPKIEPRADHIRHSAGLWLAGWIGTLALLAVKQASIVFAAARGEELAAPPDVTAPALSLLLIVLGNFAAKSRSNFFLGVRTPWTLSSEHSWSVSNRLGGWLFVLTGLSGGATSLLRDPKTGWSVLLAGIAATAVISVVVSYFAWRSDPDRQ